MDGIYYGRYVMSAVGSSHTQHVPHLSGCDTLGLNCETELGNKTVTTFVASLRDSGAI